MSEPDEPAEESEEGDRRVFVNLATAIAVLLLAIAAFWLMKTLDEHRKLENCFEFRPPRLHGAGRAGGGPAQGAVTRAAARDRLSVRLVTRAP